ncbi:hypothetical protein K432DRAFT_408695 [Lepidopterella palustris CBS 459.81]|uniref:ADP-ribose 1''-phosphate phosphatase n=1 Tax=Lepidopterella palustris CBS 459.81 TaxID=1314670 RepID=A0A8E2E214_9PEZI|nr:hypothetical protein K432DRAFT_408695 [Lepidopterella palustris CBS 459.81]
MSVIRLGTAECVCSFQALSTALQEGLNDFRSMINAEALEDEYGRFRVWSGNLGALQKGHSSLDYRLRDSPLLQKNVLKLLHELRTNLSEAVAVMLGNRLPYEKQAKPNNIEDQEDAWSQDEDDSSDDEAPKTELEQRFLDVVDIINNLYKLSVRIRSPTLRSRSLKATSYRPIDPETGADIFEQYAFFDLQYTRELLSHFRSPTADPGDSEDNYLIDRLSKAITLRRRQFKYWRRHRDKLGAASAFGNVAPQEILANKDGIGPELVGDKNPEDGTLKIIRTPTSESAPKSLISGTEATQHHRPLDEVVDSHSVTSYASTTRDLTGHGIELPSPPKTANGDRDFECPYCYIICPARYGKGRTWRTHLLQDLQPYVCTYETCEIGDQLFRSRREWSEHEAGHRKLWRCPEHTNAVFRSSASLEDHLRREHSNNFPEAQLSSIVKIGETASIDLRPKCPMCFVDSTMEGGLQNHIANHLERLAAFALPKDFDNEEGQSDGRSSVASRGRSADCSISQELSSGSAWSESFAQRSDTAARDADDLTCKLPQRAERVISFDIPSDSSTKLSSTSLSAGLLGLLPDSSQQRMETFLASSLQLSNPLAPDDDAMVKPSQTVHQEVTERHRIRGILIESQQEDDQNRHFVPVNVLREIFTEANIFKLFCENSVLEEKAYDRDFISQICRNGFRILATCILSNLPTYGEVFLKFCERDFWDKNMPLDPKALPSFCTEDEYRVLCDYQWCTLAAAPNLTPKAASSETTLAKIVFDNLPENTTKDQLDQFRQTFSVFRDFHSIHFIPSTGGWRGFVNFKDASSAAEALQKFDKSHFAPVRFYFPGNPVRFDIPESTSSKADLNIPRGELLSASDISDKSIEAKKTSARASQVSASDPLPLTLMPTLCELYLSGSVEPGRSSKAPSLAFNQKLSLILHDLTRLQVDAIVNPANRHLSPGRGETLNNAVHRAAGPSLEAECDLLNGCNIGDAKITKAYDLPCKMVIHTARPIYMARHHSERARLLARCYRRSLELAVENRMESIAFPTLSAGGYGFPTSLAARIAIKEVREFLDSGKGHTLERIVFCVYTGYDEIAYKALLPTFFPPSPTSSVFKPKEAPLFDDSDPHLDDVRDSRAKPHSTNSSGANNDQDYAYIVQELTGLQTRIEELTGDLRIFRNNVPDFDETVIDDLLGIASILNAFEESLVDSEILIRPINGHSESDIDLISVVLHTLSDSLSETISQTKYTRNLEVPSYQNIWNDFNVYLNNSQGLTLQSLLKLCKSFVLGLLRTLQWDNYEPADMGIMRDRLARYRLNQTGGKTLEEARIAKFDEVLIARELVSQSVPESYVGLIKANQIHSINSLYRSGELRSLSKSTPLVSNSKFNNMVYLVKHDITRLEVDVIVNSTDMGFSGFGSLDQAIFRAGGLTMQEDCTKFGICTEGSVRLTQGYLLPCKHVIHTVPPEIYSEYSEPLLRNCYKQALHLAVSIGARSIAFPSIGAGALEYPPLKSAAVAIQEVKRFLEEYQKISLEKIIFCVYDDNDEEVFKSLLPQYFPRAEFDANEALMTTEGYFESSTDGTKSHEIAPIAIRGPPHRKPVGLQGTEESSEAQYDYPGSITSSPSLISRIAGPPICEES